MTRKTVKAAIFDLDNTLFNQQQYLRQGFVAVGKKVAHDFNRPKLAKSVTNFLQELYVSGKRVNMFNKMMKKFFPTWTPRKINDYVEQELLMFYKMVPRKLTLFKNVLPVLSLLKKKRIKLGVVTQGNEVNQLNKLFLLGIYDYFDVVVISGQYDKKYAKPHKFLFNKALEKLNILSEKAIYIGDDIGADIGAVKAGMPLYLLTKKKIEPISNVYPIKSLLSIKDVV